MFRARLAGAIGAGRVDALLPLPDGTRTAADPGVDFAAITFVVPDAVRKIGTAPFVPALAARVTSAPRPNAELLAKLTAAAGESPSASRPAPDPATPAVPPIPALLRAGATAVSVAGAAADQRPSLIAAEFGAPDAPSRRYLVHLQAPGWNVIGATAPWMPGVAIGHNERIAWAFTPSRVDTQDIYVERFNPVFNYLETVATQPRFIETHRLSPYPARSTDIGVVLDLMIHDLDVVLAFVKSPVVSVDAVGIPVLSKSEDIANARLRFANGCVANLTVSRISPERMRKIRVFSGPDNKCYISLDYRAQEGFIYRIARDGEEESSLLKKLLASRDSTIVSEFGGQRIVREPVPIQKDEPLKLELQHFIQCVRDKQTPRVSGESAKVALDLAFEITRQVQLSK